MKKLEVLAITIYEALRAYEYLHTLTYGLYV